MDKAAHLRLLVVLTFSTMRECQSKRTVGIEQLERQFYFTLSCQTCPRLALKPPGGDSQFADTPEACRSENAGSDVKCPLPGDLNRLFYRVDVHFKSSSNVGICDPRFDFTRMLRGEIQEQDRSIDLRLCPRMQAPDPRRSVLNGRACAPRRGSADAPWPGLEIDDVCH